MVSLRVPEDGLLGDQQRELGKKVAGSGQRSPGAIVAAYAPALFRLHGPEWARTKWSGQQAVLQHLDHSG